MKKTIIWTLAFLFTTAISCKKDDKGDDKPSTSNKKFTVTVTNNFTPQKYFQSGVFTTPEGASMPGPIGPGPSFSGTEYKFSFQAAIEHKLSLATMFVQSNDWVCATGEQGIALYDANRTPLGMGGAVDVTAQIGIYDVGTEIDQVPGVGADQKPRQATDNQGAADPDVNVRAVSAAGLPAVADVIQVMVEYMGNSTFEVTVKSTSTGTTLSTPGGGVGVPLSPGGWAIHTGANAFFTLGSPVPNNGMGEIAEDGNFMVYQSYASSNTGYTSGFAPGAYAIHTSTVKVFTDGEVAPAGLEQLAEDASPGNFEAALASMANVSATGIFNDPNNAGVMGPIGPGDQYTFSFDAKEGDYLSFATMLGNTNDLFVSPNGEGIALFPGGTALSGDITGQLKIWDAGTEVNEYPGAGPNQAPRQPGANSGATENGTVELITQVNDGFTYPAVSSAISVTIQSN